MGEVQQTVCYKDWYYLWFVNDIPDRIKADVSIFADVKLMRIVTDEDREKAANGSGQTARLVT